MAMWWWLKLRNAQVSVEALTVVALMMLIIIFVLSTNTQRLEKITFIETTQAQEQECIKLQSAIALVQGTNDNSQIETNISFDANLNKNSIDFEDYYCEFPGQEINAELLKGNLRILKEEGVITVENI